MFFLRLISFSFAFTALFGLSSCKTVAEKEERNALLKAKDYAALTVGNAWTYSVKAKGSPAVEQTVSILSEVENGFFKDNMGGKMKARASGIFDGDRFLLEDPLEVGHKWLAVQGPSSVERYELVAVGELVKVPAGSFKDCVRVRAVQKGRTKTGAETQMILEWTYAPHVGLIEMKQKVQVGAQPAVENIHLQLVRFKEALAD